MTDLDRIIALTEQIDALTADREALAAPFERACHQFMRAQRHGHRGWPEFDFECLLTRRDNHLRFDVVDRDDPTESVSYPQEFFDDPASTVEHLQRERDEMDARKRREAAARLRAQAERLERGDQ